MPDNNPLKTVWIEQTDKNLLSKLLFKRKKNAKNS